VGELTKELLRSQVLTSRASRLSEELQAPVPNFAQHDWLKLVNGSVVACYASTESEPNTLEIRKILQTNGIATYLPIMRSNRELSWGLDGEELTKNPFGISEPNEVQVSLHLADALIIPALAAGRDGSRLGRGAGYYDRFLEKIPTFMNGGPLRVTLVFDDEVFESVPHELHDQHVDIVVTPTEIIDVNDSLN
jgi:5-formyltetrahydrofolate cyclo-ligase